MHQHVKIEDSCLPADNKKLARQIIDKAYELGYDNGYAEGLSHEEEPECCDEYGDKIDRVSESVRELLFNGATDVVVHFEAVSGEYIITSSQII